MSSPQKSKGSKSWSGKAKGKSKASGSHFKLKLELPFECPGTTELVLKNVEDRNKVSEIKYRVEKELGILSDMYYLSYLDSAPMEESSRLCQHDVVPGATLRVNVWRMWQELLKATLAGNIRDCFSCSQNISGDSEWSKYCAWAVLYVAAHRGQHNLVAELLKRTSVAVNFKSLMCGSTALHTTARMGRWKALCMLLNNGADVRISDNEGHTAHDLAQKYGHKKCGNSLSFCQWNLQKHRIVQERKLDYNAVHARDNFYRLAHQMVDSTMKIGFSGTQGQTYRAHIANPVTVHMVQRFEEEKTSNPSAKEKLQVKIRDDLSCHNKDGRLDFNYGWFDELRAQQLIPSTHDIIKYSNPSSCQLRPRTLLNPGGFRTSLYTPPQSRELSAVSTHTQYSQLRQSWPVQRQMQMVQLSSATAKGKVGGATAAT